MGLGLGALVEAAIGVTLVVAMFSLAASAVKEMVADQLLRMRGTTLRSAIRRLIAARHGEALRGKLAEIPFERLQPALKGAAGAAAVASAHAAAHGEATAAKAAAQALDQRERALRLLEYRRDRRAPPTETEIAEASAARDAAEAALSARRAGARKAAEALTAAVDALDARARDRLMQRAAGAAVAEFYETPDIKALKSPSWWRFERDPSAIEPARYATALLAVLGEREAVEAEAQAALERRRAALVDGVTRIAGRFNASSAGEGARAAVNAAFAEASAGLTELRTAADDAVAALEAEFDEAMVRLTGLYTRYTKIWLFFIGVGLAVGANIDILHYTKRLLVEEDLRRRAVIVAEAAIAEAPAAQQPDGDAEPTPDAGDENARTEDAPDETAGDQTAGDENAAGPEAAARDAPARPDPAAVLDELGALGVTVGWDCVGDGSAALIPGLPCLDEAAAARIDARGERAGYATPSPSKIIGWLLIGVTVTLGAQFWYDLLKSLLDLRTAGRTLAKRSDRADRA
jgi:hypothetical protein